MEKQKVKDLFKFLPKSKHKAGEGLENGEYPFYTSSAVVNKYLDEYDYDAGKLIFATGGSASVHYANSKFAVSTDNFILEPNEDVNAKYVYYYLKNNIQILQDGFHGAGLQHLSKDYLNEINIPILDSDSQEKIVSILDKVDEIRQKKKLANDKLDEFLKSTFIDMFGDPIRNDKDWNRYKMESLMTIKRGGSPRPIEKFLGGEYHWIKIGDATKNSSIYIYNTKEKIIKEGLNKTTFLPKGSLIFANCGVSLGFARILKIDGCIHDGWLSFSDIDESLNKIFLLKTLNHITDYFRKIAPDGTQPNLNTSIMKNFEVIVPPIELQNKFAKIVEKVEAQKQKNELVIEQINNLFNSLSQKAFKGEL